MKDKDKVFEKIKDVFVSNFKLDAKSITASSRFKEDFGLDSVDLMDALLILEQNLDLKIVESETSKVDWPLTMSELLAIVEKKLIDRTSE